MGRAKVLSMSSGSSASSDDGESQSESSHSDGQSNNSTTTKQKKATKKRGRGAGKAKSTGGKKPARKKRSSSTSGEAGAAVMAEATWMHASAPTMPVDADLDPWIAIQSSSEPHDDMFYPGQQGEMHLAAHLRGAGGSGAEAVDAWDSELLSFNSGHFDSFSADADYSRMLATGAGATPDNAGWLPTTYLPGVQHRASPMPAGARHQPQINQMLVLG